MICDFLQRRSSFSSSSTLTRALRGDKADLKGGREISVGKDARCSGKVVSLGGMWKSFLLASLQARGISWVFSVFFFL